MYGKSIQNVPLELRWAKGSDFFGLMS
jgi:hypothetical protein